MATSVVDDTRSAVFIEPRPVSDEGPQADLADWLWTIFGAALVVAFLTYIALTGV